MVLEVEAKEITKNCIMSVNVLELYMQTLICLNVTMEWEVIGYQSMHLEYNWMDFWHDNLHPRYITKDLWLANLSLLSLSPPVSYEEHSIHVAEQCWSYLERWAEKVSKFYLK